MEGLKTLTKEAEYMLDIRGGRLENNVNKWKKLFYISTLKNLNIKFSTTLKYLTMNQMLIY